MQRVPFIRGQGRYRWEAARHINTSVTAYSTQGKRSPGAQLLFDERDIYAQCPDAQQFGSVLLQNPFV